MRKEMTVVDKLQRTFNNLPQEKKDRINRILENYEETVFSTPHEPNNEDRLEQEITTLREQVEKLTKERGIEHDTANRFASENCEMREQLATLAEQNEKMREAVFAANEWYSIHGKLHLEELDSLIAEALSLPDLATPVLNRIRADGMRRAASLFDQPHMEYFGDRIVELINSEADELEKANG